MRIQSFADLLICKQDWSVKAHSASLPALVREPDRLRVGADIGHVLGRQFAHDARGWGQSVVVSAQASKTFGYQLGDCQLDVVCLGATDAYCIVFEPSAPGRTFAPDALTRRLLERARGLAGRQQALDAAMKALRVSLRADSVSLLRALPLHEFAVEAQEGKPAHASWPAALSPAVHAVVFSGAGIVFDCDDAGCSIIGAVDIESKSVPEWLQIPSPLLVSFLSERGSKSAHWYVGAAQGGDRFCLFVEHNAVGAVDLAKRHAAELALEVLLLVIDAEHPSTGL